MTKEQTTQAIKVMKEWLDGKQIESKLKEQKDSEFMVTSNINWNFYRFDYRVKPEPTYRPYYDADEMDKAVKEHGFTVRSKNSGQRAVVVSWTDGGIGLPNIDSFYYDYVTLLREFVWLDGTPCGVKVDEVAKK